MQEGASQKRFGHMDRAGVGVRGVWYIMADGSWKFHLTGSIA